MGDGPMFLRTKESELSRFSTFRVEPWPSLREGEPPPRWTVVADSPWGETYVFAVKPTRPEAEAWLVEQQAKRPATLAERLEAGAERLPARIDGPSKGKEQEPER